MFPCTSQPGRSGTLSPPQRPGSTPRRTLGMPLQNRPHWMLARRAVRGGLLLAAHAPLEGLGSPRVAFPARASVGALQTRDAGALLDGARGGFRCGALGALVLGPQAAVSRTRARHALHIPRPLVTSLTVVSRLACSLRGQGHLGIALLVVLPTRAEEALLARGAHALRSGIFLEVEPRITRALQEVPHTCQ